jgi:hypothetical protein
MGACLQYNQNCGLSGFWNHNTTGHSPKNAGNLLFAYWAGHKEYVENVGQSLCLDENKT